MYNNDLLLLGILGLSILLLAWITEWLASKSVIKKWISRKILHIAAIGSCSVAPLIIQKNTFPLLIFISCSAAVFLLWLIVYKGYFQDENGKKSWGIASFPWAYIVLLWVFKDNPIYIALPMSFLALGDAFACIIGRTFSSSYYIVFGDKKSVLGSLAFVAGCLLAAALLSYFFPSQIPHSANYSFRQIILLSAIVAAISEAMTRNGFDNVSIPFSSILVIYFLQNHELNTPIWLFATFPFLFIPFLYATKKSRSLSISGTFAAVFMGWLILLFSQLLFLIPPLLFLTCSVLISQLLSKSSYSADEKYDLPRDHIQVWCNGGIYLLCLALLGITKNEMWSVAAGISISLAFADTFSSEVGTRLKSKTYHIINFLPITAGVSGGVSVAGTFAGILGAAFSAFIWTFLADGRLTTYFTVMALAILGMFIDSLLGAAFQKKYMLKKGVFSDNPKPGFQPMGLKFLDNDGVNIISQIITLGIFIFAL